MAFIKRLISFIVLITRPKQSNFVFVFFILLRLGIVKVSHITFIKRPWQNKYYCSIYFGNFYITVHIYCLSCLRIPTLHTFGIYRSSHIYIKTYSLLLCRITGALQNHVYINPHICLYVVQPTNVRNNVWIFYIG